MARINQRQYMVGGIATFALGAFYVAVIYEQNTPAQAFLFPFAIMAMLAGIGLLVFSGAVYGINAIRQKIK